MTNKIQNAFDASKKCVLFIGRALARGARLLWFLANLQPIITVLTVIGVCATFVALFQPFQPGSSPGDAELPDTDITGSPTETITVDSATFTWSGSDDKTPTAGLVYSYFLDGYDSSWSDFTSATSRTYIDLPNGSYTFFVKAKDQTGKEDPSPASRTFIVSVDVDSPETAITGGPSGTITVDSVTFSWSGSDDKTLTAGLVYSYFLDGYDSSWSDFASATSKSYTNLLNRSYTFHIRAKDEVGRIDPSPASRTFAVSVDMDLPETEITGGPSGTITVGSATFTWSGSDDRTPTAGLVYSYFLQGYDSSWSNFTLATSKAYVNLPNGSYTLYVRAKDQTGNVDPSPASRSFALGSIQLISPNGNETWYMGSTYDIIWNYTGDGGVNIEYSIDGGNRWFHIALNDPNDGFHEWQVPNYVFKPTEHMRIRVSSSMDSEITDTSDDDFTICDASLHVRIERPNGGEVWPAGSERTIEWTTVSDSYVTSVTLSYSPDGGSNWTTIVEGYPDSGIYPWRLPLEAGEQHRIRVVAHDASSRIGQDESDADFEIGTNVDSWVPHALRLTLDEIRVDPTDSRIAYLGANQGGLYKTENAGETWTRIPVAHDISHVSAILVDPTHPSVVYVADEEHGLYKTGNGGVSWLEINNGFDPERDGYPTEAYALVFDPNNTDTIFAGTSDGVLKTTTAGTSWTRISWKWEDPGPTSIEDLVIDPNYPNILYAGSCSSGVYKSTNGGYDWTSKNEGLTDIRVNCLAISPHDTDVLYVGTREGLFRSVDGADSWNRLTEGLESGFIHSILVDPVHPDIVYVGTDGPFGVFMSIDAGNTWTSIGPCDAYIETLAMGTNPSVVLYVGGQGTSNFGFWTKSLD